MSQPSPKRATQAIVLSVVILALAGVLIWISVKPAGPPTTPTGGSQGGGIAGTEGGQPQNPGSTQPVNFNDPNAVMGAIGKVIMPPEGKPTNPETMGTPPRKVYVLRDGYVNLAIPSINYTHREPELFLGETGEDLSFLTSRPHGLKLPVTVNITVVRTGYKPVELKNLSMPANGMVQLPDIHLKKQ